MVRKLSYPPQFASIKKDDWRMQKYITKGYDTQKLEKEENKLWLTIKAIADNSNKPTKTSKHFSGSKLIGNGWEWAVYSLPGNKEVIKIPAGIFDEVNDREYLDNTKEAYNACRRFLGPFVPRTSFERVKINGDYLNVIRQDLLEGKETFFVEKDKMSEQLKSSFVKFSKGMLMILKEYDWLPDMNHFSRVKDGKKGWNMWNLIILNGEPKLFDFASYYDVFRMYPKRMKDEVAMKGNSWEEFLKELTG